MMMVSPWTLTLRPDIGSLLSDDTLFRMGNEREAVQRRGKLASKQAITAAEPSEPP
jgi:hypothetical protein